MADLMKGLEGLEGEVEESEIIEGDEGAIQDAVMEVIEEEVEVVEMEGEIEDMDEADDDFEESYEQLSVIRDAIDEFGLCKPMAAALGTAYTSLHEGGIVPSFEELNDLPTKGTASMEASKTIGQRLKSAWEAVKRFLKNMWAKLKEMLARFLGMFQKYSTIFKSMKAKLKDGKLSEKKLKEKKATLIPAKIAEAMAKSTMELYMSVKKSDSFEVELTSFANSISGYISSGADKAKTEAAIKKIEGSFETFVKSIKANKKLNGIEVKKAGDSFAVNSTAPEAFKSMKQITLAAAGYNASAIDSMFGEAVAMGVAVSGIGTEIKLLDATFAGLDKAIGTLIQYADKEEDASMIAINEKALKVAKRMLMVKKTVLTRAVSNINGCLKQYAIAGRAAMTCFE